MVTDSKNEDFSSFNFPFKSGFIPKDIEFDRSRGDWLHIWGESCIQYALCLELLTQERELEYLSKNEIDNELWHFTCEIYTNPQKENNPKALKFILNSFQEHLKKPLEQYEVMVPIKNLDLKGHSFDFLGVKYLTMTSNFALEWGIKQENPFHKIFYDDAIDKTVTISVEYGADPTKAAERAQRKLVANLKMLRVALLLEHEPRIIGWGIWDMQMLFSQSGHHGVRKKGDPSRFSAGWERGFTCIDFTINDDVSNQINISNLLLSNLFDNKTISINIRDRVIRALEWISNSITRESLDDKIVDLCTAFETLLTTKNDRLKGEAISLRYMLLYAKLSKPIFDPKYLFELYLKRSDIIHGSVKDICTQYDYEIGRTISLDLISKVLYYIRSNGISRHASFINDLQADKSLVLKQLDFWKGYPKYYTDIIKVGKLMLERNY